MFLRNCLLSGLGLGLGLATQLSARAEQTLPYVRRTHGYSAWDTSVRGDLRTVGMSGALVGLADSRIGGIDNPAGLPMTLDSTGIQFTGNSIQDGYIQSYPSMISTNNAVITWCPFPWGVSFASYAPQSEGDTYRVGAGSTAQDAQFSITTQEFRLSAARVSLSDRLSLGLTMIVGQNTQTISPVSGTKVSHSAWGFGAGLGVLYQLPNRWLLGLSYTPPIHYSMGSFGDASPLVGSFFQSADAPYRLGMGGGWVPNRFFSAAAGLYVIGSTSNAALLGDDSRLVGDAMTLQPRFGISYLLAEYKEFKIELAAGTYVEVLRVQDTFARWHGTVAVEFKPWVINLGWGLDEARLYQNFIYTAGIDIGKLLRKLDLIPPDKHYPYAGFFPNPTHMSDQGLPRALVRNYKDVPGPTLLDISLDMPGKLKDKILSAPEAMKSFGTDVLDSFQKLPGVLGEDSAPEWEPSPPAPPRLLTPSVKKKQ